MQFKIYIYVVKKTVALRHKSYFTLASSMGLFSVFPSTLAMMTRRPKRKVSPSPDTHHPERERERESSWKDQFVCTGNCVMLITTLIWAELAF